jgi:hypothetical protein
MAVVPSDALCIGKRKPNSALRFVPFENEQSSQVGIFEKLAVGLVALFIPASYLAGLDAIMSAPKSNPNDSFHGGLTLSQYQKDEHLPQRCEAPSLPHP